MNPEKALKIIKMSDQEKWRSGISKAEEQEAYNLIVQVLEDYNKNRADIEFLNWCFANAKETMTDLTHKYNNDELWQY